MNPMPTMKNYDDVRRAIGTARLDLEASEKVLTSFNKYGGKKLSDLSMAIVKHDADLQTLSRQISNLSMSLMSSVVIRSTDNETLHLAGHKIGELRNRCNILIHTNHNLMKVTAEGAAKDQGLCNNGSSPHIIQLLLPLLTYQNSNSFWCYSYIPTTLDKTSTKERPKIGLFHVTELVNVECEIQHYSEHLQAGSRVSREREAMETPLDWETVFDADPFASEVPMNPTNRADMVIPMTSNRAIWCHFQPSKNTIAHSTRTKPLGLTTYAGYSYSYDLLAPSAMTILHTGEEYGDTVGIGHYALKELARRCQLVVSEVRYQQAYPQIGRKLKTYL